MEGRKHSGLGLLGTIQIVLIVLRMTKVITWKWYVVLLPWEIELSLILLYVLWYWVHELMDKLFY